MADVFSKLGDSLKSTIKVASEQTQMSVEQVSGRADIINKKNEIKKLFMLLGQAQYKCYLEECGSIERNSLYSKIDELRSQVIELEQKINEANTAQKDSFDNFKQEFKNTWSEANTKDDIFNDDIFSPDYKTKSSVPKADEYMSRESSDSIEQDDILVICPVCHTENHDYATYCMRCGNKLK